jgi:hypothetical protein
MKIFKLATIFYFLDKSIDVLFEGIFRNFAIHDKSIYNFKVGQLFDMYVNGIDDIGVIIFKKCQLISKKNKRLVIRCNHAGNIFNVILEHGQPVQIEEI